MNTQNGSLVKPADEKLQDEEFTPEELTEISGYQPETVELIDREFMLLRDSEKTEQRDSSENPLVRLCIAALLVGGVMGLGWMIWAIFFAPKPIPTPVASPTPKPTASVAASDEASRLKAELALRNQASRVQQQQLPKPSQSSAKLTPTTSGVARSVPVSASPHRIIQEPAPPPRIVQLPAPPPRIIRERVPSPTPVQSQPRTFVASATPTPQSSPENVDPFVRWNQLATLGQQTTRENALLQEKQLTTAATVESATPSNASVSSNTPTPSTQQPAAIPVVSIGNNPNNTSETAGERGILNRTEVAEDGSGALASSGTMQIQIGTSAQAKVLVPMIWSEEDKSQGRFAVELSEDVLSIDNQVALPKGTILITEVDSVSKANMLVKQSVVAVVYPDSSGQIRQQTIPKDSILIRGEDNHPLIARGMQDQGAAIAQQDILVGLLGAAGQAGTVFNQAQTQSSTIISSGGFTSQSTQTTNPRPNILAAAVQGFFQPMSQRLGQRADQTTNELLQRPKVAIVPQGTQISVFFNTFFEVTR